MVKVKAHTRKTENGKIIRVKSHNRKLPYPSGSAGTNSPINTKVSRMVNNFRNWNANLWEEIQFSLEEEWGDYGEVEFNLWNPLTADVAYAQVYIDGEEVARLELSVPDADVEGIANQLGVPAEQALNYDNLLGLEQKHHLLVTVRNDLDLLNDQIRSELIGEGGELPGGLAEQKGITAGDVDPVELRKGIEIEMEHTRDKHIAREIALDHLAEIPDYYSRLVKMEEEAERGT